MPSAWPQDDGRKAPIITQGVLLALGRRERDRSAHGAVQGDLAAADVAPVRRVRILEIREPDPRPGIEGVDRHLRFGRPGDLYPAVLQVGRGGGDAPITLAHLARLRQEVETMGPRHFGSPLAAKREQLVAPDTEPLLQLGDEGEGLGHENLLATLDGTAGHADLGHRVTPSCLPGFTGPGKFIIRTLTSAYRKRKPTGQL